MLTLKMYLTQWNPKLTNKKNKRGHRINAGTERELDRFCICHTHFPCDSIAPISSHPTAVWCSDDVVVTVSCYCVYIIGVMTQATRIPLMDVQLNQVLIVLQVNKINASH